MTTQTCTLQWEDSKNCQSIASSSYKISTRTVTRSKYQEFSWCCFLLSIQQVELITGDHSNWSCWVRGKQPNVIDTHQEQYECNFMLNLFKYHVLHNVKCDQDSISVENRLLFLFPWQNFSIFQQRNWENFGFLLFSQCKFS